VKCAGLTLNKAWGLTACIGNIHIWQSWIEGDFHGGCLSVVFVVYSQILHTDVFLIIFKIKILRALVICIRQALIFPAAFPIAI
jgi:hypothetical protein